MKLLARVGRILGWLVVAIVVLVLVVAAGAYSLLVRRPFPVVNGSLQVAGLSDRVEIYRDRWGVPHIYARDMEDLYFAQGYVHAQDRLWQMDFNRRVGHGRLSEVLGETTLETDRFLRTLGLARAAAADLALADEETLRTLRAYAEGVNAFIEGHRGNLPLEFRILGYTPEPWEPLDSLVWGKVMAWDLGGNWSHELFRARLIQALGQQRAQELLPPYPEDGPFIIPPEAKSYAGLGKPSLEGYEAIKRVIGLGEGLTPAVGSNNWVVDGTKSVTGKPLLANDPHLSIQMPSIWYEVGLHGPEFNAVGASFPGVPGIIIGHNDHIAWGVTNVGPDVQDLYIEKVNPDNNYQVEFQGQWKDVQVVHEEIDVKGRARPVELEVRITQHGPIMNDVVDGLEQTLALKWTATSEPNHIFRSVALLNRARNWEEFREALKYWSAPSQNFVYADTEGNIGYQMPGLIPIRAGGMGLVPVPGWTGEYEWTGFIPFEELPSVYNPPTHFIVTANNKVVPDDYRYFISAEWAPGYRARRITQLLTAQDKLSADDFRDIQADVYTLPAEVWVPRLLALQLDGWLEKQALAELKNWDLRSTPDSTGAAIYHAFTLKLVENTFRDELGDELFEDYLGASGWHHLALERMAEDPTNPWFDDVNTPQAETLDDILAQSFTDGVDLLGNRFGDAPGQWTWGRLHKAVFNHKLGVVKPLDLIFNSRPLAVPGYGYTVFNTGYSFGDPFETRTVPSYRQIIDLGTLANSRSQHTTGQSGLAFHKHYADMIAGWRDVEHHPMLFYKEMIEQNQEGLLVLEPGR